MQRIRKTQRLAGGMIITLSMCVACAIAQEAPSLSDLAPQGAATPVELDPAVDKVLTQLEKREVHDLRAKVKWELAYVVEEEEDSTCKLGTIWYRQSAPVAKFKVHFDKKIAGTTARPLDEQHLFDGRWYTELQSTTKTVTRREIRREDDASNPYKLGEGPFPLPFGQKKADILREFEVSVIPEKKNDPPDADHLLLKPRPDTATGQTYKTVEFWVLRSGADAGLPVKVVAGKKDGTGAVNSYITITFSKVELNAGIGDGVFKIETPPGYEQIVEPLQSESASITIKGTSP